MGSIRCKKVYSKSPGEDWIYCGGNCPTECEDVDNDGLPDDWEINYFGDLDEGPDGDFEPDGITNLDEYKSGTDPTKVDEEKECTIDSNCDPGYVCNYKFKCVEDGGRTNPSSVDEGSNIWGWILIILGILLIGGGSYYIYYSRDQKVKEAQQQQQQLMANRADMTAKQREADEARLAKLKEEHLKQRETREKKLEERKKKRKSLLGAFDINDDHEENKSNFIDGEEDGEINDDKIVEKKKPKEDKKLDEGFHEEYIEVDKLGTKPPLKDETHFKKPSKPKPTAKKQDSFAALKLLIAKKQPVSKITAKAKPLSSHDVVAAFAKDLGKKKLDEHTLVSLLKVMADTRKINAVTVRNVLHELADKKYIPAEDIDDLFNKIM